MCREQVFPVFHLALADLFASCGLFASSIVYRVITATFKFNTSSTVARDGDAVKAKFNETIAACRLAGGPVLCLYAITFLVTAAYAVYRYLAIRASLKPRAATITTETAPLLNKMKWIKFQRSYVIVIYGIAWLTPVLIAIVMAIVYEEAIAMDHGLDERFQNQLWCINGCLQMFNNGFQQCHSHGRATRWFISYRWIFHGTLLITVVMNMILYYLFVKMSKTSIKEEGVMNGFQRERIRRTQWRVFWYQIVFISCWISSLILAVLSTIEWAKGSDLYNGTAKTPWYYFALYYIQALTAPLQGFLNAIVYGWNRRAFRTAASCIKK